jgi:hypothetical protein
MPCLKTLAGEESQTPDLQLGQLLVYGFPRFSESSLNHCKLMPGMLFWDSGAFKLRFIAPQFFFARGPQRGPDQIPPSWAICRGLD